MSSSRGRQPQRGATPRTIRAAIAGGGIGGMALALSLHSAGFSEVDVYESASSVPVEWGRQSEGEDHGK